MFAYGQRYLNGIGDLFLIYPKTRDFSRTLPMFQFSNDLRLGRLLSILSWVALLKRVAGVSKGSCGLRTLVRHGTLRGKMPRWTAALPRCAIRTKNLSIRQSSRPAATP